MLAEETDVPCFKVPFWFHFKVLTGSIYTTFFLED